MKKILSLIAILFVLLVAAVGVYVQSDAFSERIKPFVLGPLQAVLGPDARVGRIKANFLPPYLDVRDIMIPDARGNEAVSVRRIKVYLNPVPLLVKKVQLPSISLIEPRINLERAADGTFNITPLVERIRQSLAKPEREEPAFSLLLKTISVRQGEIRFKDEGLSSRATITGLDMTARFNVAKDHISVNLRSSRITFSAPAYPEIAGTLKAAGEYDRGLVRVKTFDLEAGDTALNVSGTMGLLPESGLDLKGKLRSGPQSLSRLAQLFNPGQKRQTPRVEASVTVTGKNSDPQVSGNVRFSGFAYRGLTLKNVEVSIRYRDHVLAVSGEKGKTDIYGKALIIDRVTADLAYRDGVLDVRRAEIASGDLAVRMEGIVGQTRGFDAGLAVESSGEGKTLSLLTGMPVEGGVAMKGRLTGALNAPLVEGTIEAGPVVARRVQFDHVAGILKYRDRVISIESADIRRQSSSYVFDGSADFKGGEPSYAARLKVAQSDVAGIVALFYEPLPLKITATGELSFRWNATNYSGSGSLSLDAGSAYGESFTRGVVTAELTKGKISFPEFVLYKKKGMARATGWIGFDGTYSADLEISGVGLSSVDHMAGTDLDGDANLRLHTAGSFSTPVLNATFAVEKFSFRGTGMGTLRGSADIKDHALKAEAGLPEDAASLTLDWMLRKPYTWTAEAKVKTDGFNPLLLFGNAALAERVKLIASGGIRARGTGLDRSSVSGDASFSRIAVVIGEYRIDSESQPALTISRGRLAARSLDFAGPSTRFSVSGTTDLSTEIDVAVKGTVNLPILRLFFPEVEHATGTAEMKLTVTDEWSNPDVAGELRIRDGEIKFADIPQRFTALNGTIVFTQGRIMTESLTGEIGGGSLAASGWVQLSGVTIEDFSVKTTVDSVQVRYPEGLTSTLSGDLYFDGGTQGRSLSGDIVIKRARYDKPIEWKSMLVSFGRGLYQKKKTEIGWIGETQINVRFHGSENILFQNNLAKMQLDIDVFLRGTVNHPQFLGRIETSKGSVFLRKNEFKIVRASADFIDPNRINPVLDIQAETQVREYQIQLSITGTAERASVTLVSDPALNDTDILSLLALGKKGSELRGKGESTVGIGEAASFATGQFQDVLERRAKSLTGLDRFQVDPYVSKNDTSVPRVTAGKELIQNKLFVTYSSNVGAPAPEQNFRIEYILDKHFSLVGEGKETIDNGTDIGGDIKYRFEFQ